MNFTAIFCCYVLLPYFASIVSPPQVSITCSAGAITLLRRTKKNMIGKIKYFISESREALSKKLPIPAKVRPQVLPVPAEVQLQIEPVPAEVQLQTEPVDENLLEDNYFDQKRDHYHFNDRSKWPQRYLVHDKHYSGNGVIFIWIGTDEDITSWNMQNGCWYDYCRKAHALCIGIENRGYGVSLPHGNLNDENLKYLNNEQTLADVAWFINNFRSLRTDYKLPEKLKWVAYGKGKQGALATWLRMKFPHLVHATWSLSAPILAKEEFNEYFNDIESDMLNEEMDLRNEIRYVYKSFANQLEKINFEGLGKIFSFCDQKLLLDNEKRDKNVDFIYFTFAQTIALIMQCGSDELKQIKNDVNNIMLGLRDIDEYLSPIGRFALLVKMVSNTKEKECLQMSYDVAISEFKTTTRSEYQLLHYPLPQTFGNRVTLYQSCNEFGQFETFEKFFNTSIDLTFYTELCRDVFEEEYYPEGQLKKGIRRTNVFYGGLSIVVSRVIFVYGSLDPFRNLGIKSHSSSNTMDLLGARHCYEIENFRNNPFIEHVKQEIFIKLRKWLQ